MEIFDSALTLNLNYASKLHIKTQTILLSLNIVKGYDKPETES